MPRSHPIARITVDRPHLWEGARAERCAEWLEARAYDIEAEPNVFSLTGFTARRIAGLSGVDTVAKLRIGAAGCLSLETRKRIAKWLRSRAKYLRKHWAVAQTSRRGWFVQEFSL